MCRQLAFTLALTLSAGVLSAQDAARPRVGSQPSLGNEALRVNAFEANEPVAMTNRVVKPIPMSAETQKTALSNIDRQISSQASALAKKVKSVLPDELAILTKTTGWTAENQQALVTALRAGDPTAVYETWVKGNPQDTAGAELVARQTNVKRLATQIVQDAEKNTAALSQDVSDFDAALGKITGTTPEVDDLQPKADRLQTWVQARKLIAEATPGKGRTAHLPSGDDVNLIFDPTLAVGTVVVLNDDAVLIGHDGHNALRITEGNAAEALGLPIVTGTPLPEVQGKEVTDGVLILNPAETQGTVNYGIDGNHYVARSGMRQVLPPRNDDRHWVIEYDRGADQGPARYTLRSGTYRFAPTELGWQLYRERYSITLDNSESEQEFNFIFHGEDMIVPAGGTLTLNSKYPVVVRFDRGNGGDFVARKTPQNVGTIQVGVNAADNLWDLFPESGNRREANNVKPFNTNGDTRRN